MPSFRPSPEPFDGRRGGTVGINDATPAGAIPADAIPAGAIPADALAAGAMRRAIELSARGLGTTSPNPVVGCVVLDVGGRVVGEGWHEFAGGPHAEVNALAAAGERARGGTAVVTLEPCNHVGRTGP